LHTVALLVPDAPLFTPIVDADRVEAIKQKVAVPKPEKAAIFAVIEIGGHQFKVCEDDLIYSEKLDVDIGTAVRLDRVLLLGTTTETTVGQPLVQGASVTVWVEEQIRDSKVIVFKKRRRKNWKRWQGHRQSLTVLRIVEINPPLAASA